MLLSKSATNTWIREACRGLNLEVFKAASIAHSFDDINICLGHSMMPEYEIILRCVGCGHR